MQFNDFIKTKKVQKITPDLQKSKALINSSKINLRVVESIPLNNISASIILSNSYECLRQILEAIALKNGYKVYSHEAYTYYLSELNEENLSFKFDRLRKLRNGITYYGENTSEIIAKDALETVKNIVDILVKKYLS